MTAQPNATLAYRVLDHIDAHPESWDQRTWDCGTTACFAGWAVRISGGIIQGLSNSDAEVVDTTDEFARWMLGMTPLEAASHLLGIGVDTGAVAADPETGLPHWLFDAYNDRARLGRLVAEIFGPRPRSCCASTEDVGHDFTCSALLGAAGVVIDDVPPNAGSAS